MSDWNSVHRRTSSASNVLVQPQPPAERHLSPAKPAQDVKPIVHNEGKKIRTGLMLKAIGFETGLTDSRGAGHATASQG